MDYTGDFSSDEEQDWDFVGERSKPAFQATKQDKQPNPDSDDSKKTKQDLEDEALSEQYHSIYGSIEPIHFMQNEVVVGQAVCYDFEDEIYDDTNYKNVIQHEVPVYSEENDDKMQDFVHSEEDAPNVAELPPELRQEYLKTAEFLEQNRKKMMFFDKEWFLNISSYQKNYQAVPPHELYTTSDYLRGGPRIQLVRCQMSPQIPIDFINMLWIVRQINSMDDYKNCVIKTEETDFEFEKGRISKILVAQKVIDHDYRQETTTMDTDEVDFEPDGETDGTLDNVMRYGLEFHTELEPNDHVFTYAKRNLRKRSHTAAFNTEVRERQILLESSRKGSKNPCIIDGYAISNAYDIGEGENSKTDFTNFKNEEITTRKVRSLPNAQYEPRPPIQAFIQIFPCYYKEGEEWVRELFWTLNLIPLPGFNIQEAIIQLIESDEKELLKLNLRTVYRKLVTDEISEGWAINNLLQTNLSLLMEDIMSRNTGNEFHPSRIFNPYLIMEKVANNIRTKLQKKGLSYDEIMQCLYETRIPGLPPLNLCLPRCSAHLTAPMTEIAIIQKAKYEEWYQTFTRYMKYIKRNALYKSRSRGRQKEEWTSTFYFPNLYEICRVMRNGQNEHPVFQYFDAPITLRYHDFEKTADVIPLSEFKPMTLPEIVQFCCMGWTSGYSHTEIMKTCVMIHQKNSQQTLNYQEFFKKFCQVESLMKQFLIAGVHSKWAEPINSKIQKHIMQVEMGQYDRSTIRELFSNHHSLSKIAYSLIASQLETGDINSLPVRTSVRIVKAFHKSAHNKVKEFCVEFDTVQNFNEMASCHGSLIDAIRFFFLNSFIDMNQTLNANAVNLTNMLELFSSFIGNYISFNKHATWKNLGQSSIIARGGGHYNIRGTSHGPSNEVWCDMSKPNSAGADTLIKQFYFFLTELHKHSGMPNLFDEDFTLRTANQMSSASMRDDNVFSVLEGVVKKRPEPNTFLATAILTEFRPNESSVLNEFMHIIPRDENDNGKQQLSGKGKAAGKNSDWSTESKIRLDVARILLCSNLAARSTQESQDWHSLRCVCGILPAGAFIHPNKNEMEGGVDNIMNKSMANQTDLNSHNQKFRKFDCVYSALVHLCIVIGVANITEITAIEIGQMPRYILNSVTTSFYKYFFSWLTNIDMTKGSGGEDRIVNKSIARLMGSMMHGDAVSACYECESMEEAINLTITRASISAMPLSAAPIHLHRLTSYLCNLRLLIAQQLFAKILEIPSVPFDWLFKVLYNAGNDAYTVMEDDPHVQKIHEWFVKLQENKCFAMKDPAKDYDVNECIPAINVPKTSEGLPVNESFLFCREKDSEKLFSHQKFFSRFHPEMKPILQSGLSVEESHIDNIITSWLNMKMNLFSLCKFNMQCPVSLAKFFKKIHMADFHIEAGELKYIQKNPKFPKKFLDIFNRTKFPTTMGQFNRHDMSREEGAARTDMHRIYNIHPIMILFMNSLMHDASTNKNQMLHIGIQNCVAKTILQLFLRLHPRSLFPGNRAVKLLQFSEGSSGPVPDTVFQQGHDAEIMLHPLANPRRRIVLEGTEVVEKFELEPMNLVAYKAYLPEDFAHCRNLEVMWKYTINDFHNMTPGTRNGISKIDLKDLPTNACSLMVDEFVHHRIYPISSIKARKDVKRGYICLNTSISQKIERPRCTPQDETDFEDCTVACRLINKKGLCKIQVKDCAEIKFGKKQYHISVLDIPNFFRENGIVLQPLINRRQALITDKEEGVGVIIPRIIDRDYGQNIYMGSDLQYLVKFNHTMKLVHWEQIEKRLLPIQTPLFVNMKSERLASAFQTTFPNIKAFIDHCKNLPYNTFLQSWLWFPPYQTLEEERLYDVCTVIVMSRDNATEKLNSHVIKDLPLTDILLKNPEGVNTHAPGENTTFNYLPI